MKFHIHPIRYMISKFSTPLKKIAVFTSGGDAPGMNAAIRSVVRSAIYRKLEVVGVIEGYQGLIQQNFVELNLRSVANIIQRGGTLLKTARCPQMMLEDTRKQVALTVKNQKLDALICIGGDGSFRAAESLWKEHQIPMIGIPSTIDNDVFGTDYSIGFDTAVNTAVEAIDRIRDTAASHNRLFIIEVMGKATGFLALSVGLSGGAEEIFIPEISFPVQQAIEHVQAGIANHKKSSILIAAEGEKPGRAYDLAEALRKKSGLEAKVCILGHVQRGGSPSAMDRILASQLGAFAIETVRSGYCNAMVGVNGSQLLVTDLTEALAQKKKINNNLIDLIRILSL